ncbi:hypothetical protein [Ruthenibacterium lactatiformans]|uniref:hypothetical protein n=1 Tax=Ruthenibacterium lactatiformans TaxID=1550024 RepID=UPI003AEFD2A0
MSVTYGFYNSIKGDRKYNALEMSSIFDGIIVDGVYMSIGDALNVKSSGGMGITVGIGRAWFNHTWTLNDSLLPLTLANSDVLLNRIDAIVLEVNNNTEVRKNTIKILKGTPSSKPVKPTMTEGELLNQHPLAYISIPAGATSISQSNIENAVGTSACPYVTGVLKGMDIDKLVAQWGAQWAEWLSSNTDAWKAFMSDNTNEWKSFMAKNKNEWSALINGNTSEFETWFEHMKDQLSEDAAGNLQLQVDNLNNAALGGDFVLKGSPVSVEYMGANRIASITAYGENAQGGTTEAPVALTGVDSVFVSGNNLLPKAVRTETTEGISGILTKQKEDNILYATIQVLAGTTVNTTIYPMLNLGESPLPYEPYQGSVTPLPIPRPLHKVGDVRDVCRTRVKSVYDKRIVLDGSEANLGYNEEYSTLLITGVLTAGSITETNVYGVCISSHFSSIPAGGHSTGKTDIIWSQPRLKQLVIHSPKFSSLETAKAYLSAQKAAGTPVTVYYQSTSCNGTNGLDVCLTEYQTGFVELDGTEPWVWNTSNPYIFMVDFTANHKAGVAPVCSHYQGAPGDVPQANQVIINSNGTIAIKDLSWQSAEDAKSYLAAQKAAGTPVQIAYQLATPETYATDPIDFDNAAGPLTVLTGGAVEVRMTELVGSRTYDADGDGVVDKAAAVPWDGVTGKPGTFTPSAHTHDDRYYTETEMNTKLNGKADSGHTHTSIRMYNSDWSGTDGLIMPVYANANKDYVNLSAENDAGNKWPHISCQRINGHALNMSLSGTTLSITW